MSADNLHRFERIKALKLERLLLRQRVEQLDRQIAALKSQTAYRRPRRGISRTPLATVATRT
jgi:hypothetical protein